MKFERYNVNQKLNFNKVDTERMFRSMMYTMNQMMDVIESLTEVPIDADPIEGEDDEPDELVTPKILEKITDNNTKN